MVIHISKSMIVIRKARLNDIDTLISLENELYDNQIEYEDSLILSLNINISK